MYEDIKDKLSSAKEYLEGLGYEVAYICIYGSQNYELDIYTDEYKSDFDFKAVIIPTLNDLVYNCKPESKILEYDGGQIDVKDIRHWMEVVCKGNPAYIETLYSKYSLIDEKYEKEMNEIISFREDLLYCLRYQFARAIYGMAKEKEAAFEYPYPSCKADIEKYGYSPKQLHHIVRLYYLLSDFIYTRVLKLVPERKDFLLNIKTGEYDYTPACEIRDFYIKNLKTLKDEFISSIDENKIDYSTKNKVIDLSKEIIKKCIIEKILEENK